MTVNCGDDTKSCWAGSARRLHRHHHPPVDLARLDVVEDAVDVLQPRLKICARTFPSAANASTSARFLRVPMMKPRMVVRFGTTSKIGVGNSPGAGRTAPPCPCAAPSDFALTATSAPRVRASSHTGRRRGPGRRCRDRHQFARPRLGLLQIFVGGDARAQDRRQRGKVGSLRQAYDISRRTDGIFGEGAGAFVARNEWRRRLDRPVAIGGMQIIIRAMTACSCQQERDPGRASGRSLRWFNCLDADQCRPFRKVAVNTSLMPTHALSAPAEPRRIQCPIRRRP